MRTVLTIIVFALLLTGWSDWAEACEGEPAVYETVEIIAMGIK